MNFKLKTFLHTTGISILSRVLLILFSTMCLVATSTLHAQEVDNEFQSRTSAKLSYSPIKKLKLSFIPEVRFDEQMFLDKYLLEGEIRYKPYKLLSLEATYRFVGNRRKVKDTEYLHQYAFGASLKKNIGRFSPSLRIRYANYADDQIDNKEYMRYRVKLKYDIAKNRLTPFVGAELFQQLSANELAKVRYTIGANYKLFSKNYIGLSYNLDYYMQEYKNRHIASLCYKVKF